MLVSSRTSLKRVNPVAFTRLFRENEELSAINLMAIALRNRMLRHASSVVQQASTQRFTQKDVKRPLTPGLRHGPWEFQPDPSHTKTMTRTSQARYAMQMREEAEKGRIHECLAIASKMKAAGMRPDLAWAILDDMLLVGIKPNAASFNHLIHAQRQKASHYVLKAIERLNELEVAPNSSTFTLLIKRYVYAGNLEMALQYFYAMKAHELVPDLAAASNLINLAAQYGYPRLAIDLVEYFEKHSVRRLGHEVWMECLISSAENLYEDGVLHCWKTVVEDLKITPDEGLCMSVLNAAARHGIPDLATGVLRVLKDTGVPWQEHHFASVIEASCRANQMREALLSIDTMRNSGVEPVAETLYPLLDSIKHDISAIDAAWTIIDELHKDGKSIDIHIINILIEASIILGDLQRAVGAYKSFPEYGITATVRTFDLLLQGCVTASHRVLGDLLLSDMKEAKLRPDRDTFVQMVYLCLTQEMYEDAFYYLEEMKVVGHVPRVDVYVALVRKCISVGDVRYAIALDEMKEYGYKVPPELMWEVQELASQRTPPTNPSTNMTQEPQPVGLGAAAQRFIETGGLSPTEETSNPTTHDPKTST